MRDKKQKVFTQLSGDFLLNKEKSFECYYCLNLCVFQNVTYLKVIIYSKISFFTSRTNHINKFNYISKIEELS